MGKTGADRTAALVLTVVAMALAVVVLALVADGRTSDTSEGSRVDPARALEDALAAGTPAYVLVHSAT